MRRLLATVTVIAVALLLWGSNEATAAVTRGTINFALTTDDFTNCQDKTPYIVSDAASKSDCTTGGGSVMNLCICSSGALVDEDSGGAESNNLEVDGAVGIADTELFIGTGPGTGVYVAMSGDGTLSNAGALTIAANAVALGTDTTGGYAASTSEAGGATSLENGALNALAEIASGLCGTNELLFDTGGAWTCSSAPTLTGTNFTGIPGSAITSYVRSEDWGLWNITADNQKCRPPSEETIGSWGAMPTIVCAADNASTLTFSKGLNDGWDGGTVAMEVCYVQDAADTGSLLADVACRCAGSGETPAAYPAEVALDDAAVTGSDAIDCVTTAALTPAGTCAGGDFIQCQYQVDATSTTAMATLHYVSGKIELTDNFGD